MMSMSITDSNQTLSLLNNNMLPTNVLLEIVSTGKDQGLLEQLIEKCEENVKKKIRL